MKPFRFRAQPALDIRRSQDDAAQRALAVAQAALTRAEQDVDAALATVDAGHARGAASVAGARNAHELEWHCNWMIGLEREVARARQHREERRIDVKTATIKALDARRALRALERLRERALRDYGALARREEQKALDLLGSLQHAVKGMHREEIS
jgi:flagellar export protein FliJ